VTTAIVGSVAGQGNTQVVSNALAPYASQFIGSQFDPNHGENPDATMQLMSHAVLGALLAEANGGSAGNGALAAGGGELAAKFLTEALYGGNPENLDEQQRQTILALSEAIGALAGGVGDAGLDGSSLGASIAANVVENNYLSHPQREQRDKEKLACGSDTACKFAVESRWAELSQDQSRDMKDRYSAYLTPEEQAIVFSLKPGTDAYDTLIAHAMLREAAKNPLFISSLYGGDFRLLTETDWDGPQFNSFASGMTLADRNRLEMAVLGPIAGAPSTLASLLGARPETIALTNQLGMIAWDVAGSIAVLGPKSPSTGPSQLGGLISPQDGRGVGGGASKLPSQQSADLLLAQSQGEVAKLAGMYNTASLLPKDFTLKLGGTLLRTDPVASTGAPVFLGASTADVMAYFQTLGGLGAMPPVRNIPGKGQLYVISTPGGTTLRLRDFSTSKNATGATWTIDIVDPSINGGRAVEMKFK
jgi:hypothetical protein